MGVAAMAPNDECFCCRHSFRRCRIVVRSATCDQGIGSYTAMPQTAAEILEVEPERIRFELGDTAMPLAPISAGSQTVASMGSAVQVACRSLQSKLISLARADPASLLYGVSENAIRLLQGHYGASVRNPEWMVFPAPK